MAKKKVRKKAENNKPAESNIQPINRDLRKVTLPGDYQFQVPAAAGIFSALQETKQEQRIQDIDKAIRKLEIRSSESNNKSETELKAAYDAIALAKEEKIPTDEKTRFLTLLTNKAINNGNLYAHIQQRGGFEELSANTPKMKKEKSDSVTPTEDTKEKQKNEAMLKIQKAIEELAKKEKQEQEKKAAEKTKFLNEIKAAADKRNNKDRTPPTTPENPIDQTTNKIKYTVCWSKRSSQAGAPLAIDGVMVHENGKQHYLKYDGSTGELALDSAIPDHPSLHMPGDTKRDITQLNTILQTLGLPSGRPIYEKDAIFKAHLEQWKTLATDKRTLLSDFTFIQLKLYFKTYENALAAAQNDAEKATLTTEFHQNLAVIIGKLEGEVATDKNKQALATNYYTEILSQLHSAAVAEPLKEVHKALATAVTALLTQTSDASLHALLHGQAQVLKDKGLLGESETTALNKAAKSTIEPYVAQLIADLKNPDLSQLPEDFIASLANTAQIINRLTENQWLTETHQSQLQAALTTAKDGLFEHIKTSVIDDNTLMTAEVQTNLRTLGMPIEPFHTDAADPNNSISTLSYGNHSVAISAERTDPCRLMTKKAGDGDEKVLIVIDPDNGSMAFAINSKGDDIAFPFTDNEGNTWLSTTQQDDQGNGIQTVHYCHPDQPDHIYQVLNDGTARQLDTTVQNDVNTINKIKSDQARHQHYDDINSLLRDYFGDNLSDLNYSLLYAKEGEHDKFIVAVQKTLPNNETDQFIIEHTTENKFRMLSSDEKASITCSYMNQAGTQKANFTYSCDNQTNGLFATLNQQQPAAMTYNYSNDDFQQQLQQWTTLRQLETKGNTLSDANLETLQQHCAQVKALQTFVKTALENFPEVLEIANRTHALIEQLNTAVIEHKGLSFDEKTDLINHHLPSNNDVELVAYAHADGRSGHIVEAHYDVETPRTSTNYFNRGSYTAASTCCYHHDGTKTKANSAVVTRIANNRSSSWQDDADTTHLWHNQSLLMHHPKKKAGEKWQQADFSALPAGNQGISPAAPNTPDNTTIVPGLNALLEHHADHKQALHIHDIAKLFDLQSPETFHIYEESDETGLPKHFVISDGTDHWAFEREATGTGYLPLAPANAQTQNGGDSYSITSAYGQAELIKRRFSFRKGGHREDITLENFAGSLRFRGSRQDNRADSETVNTIKRDFDTIFTQALHSTLGHYAKLAKDETIGFNIAEDHAFRHSVLKQGQEKIANMDTQIERLKTEKKRLDECLALLGDDQLAEKLTPIREGLKKQQKNIADQITQDENYRDNCQNHLDVIKNSVNDPKRKITYKDGMLTGDKAAGLVCADKGAFNGQGKTVLHQQQAPSRAGATGLEITTELVGNSEDKLSLARSVLKPSPRAQDTNDGFKSFFSKPPKGNQAVCDEHKRAAVAFGRNLALNSDCVVLNAADTASSAFRLSALTLLSYPPGNHCIPGTNWEDTMIDINYLCSLLRDEKQIMKTGTKEKGIPELVDLIKYDHNIAQALKRFLSDVRDNTQPNTDGTPREQRVQKAAFKAAAGISEPKKAKGAAHISMGDLLAQIRNYNMPLEAPVHDEQMVSGVSISPRGVSQ